ncbi:MAG: MBL fold metallo-hydrolase RNA specificity domain-containing protein [Anaerolineae bacterium]
MQIEFHGAVRTVTGSQHLVRANGTNILLDCGLYQGRRAETYMRNHNFPFDPHNIDLVILSHAHIDHSGNLPNLVKQGFTGDILCTSATRDLAATMLPDSGFIQERDAEYINKKRRKQGETPIEPLYTHADALAILGQFITQGYHRRRKIAPDVYLTFYEAGHMLGSCIVQLEIGDSDNEHMKTLVFSGDLGRKGIPIIRDPEIIDGADYLIMESTYGNRLHETYADSEDRLRQIVNTTYERGGSIVMPAFAVGRTQQLVRSLHELAQQGAIPSMPIYVDSPLAVDATSVFQLHPECYDIETRTFMSEYDVRNPFGFDDLTYIRKVEDSIALNSKTEPHIVISASGMAEFGRIVHHLKHRLRNPNNTVLITGWQAEHTLGWRLAEGVSPVRIFGDEYEVNAHVEIINGFSGHADRDEMIEWIDGMGQKPERVFLVHGEEDAMYDFKTTLKAHFGFTVDVPQLGQKYTL